MTECEFAAALQKAFEEATEGMSPMEAALWLAGFLREECKDYEWVVRADPDGCYHVERVTQ